MVLGVYKRCSSLWYCNCLHPLMQIFPSHWYVGSRKAIESVKKPYICIKVVPPNNNLEPGLKTKKCAYVESRVCWVILVKDIKAEVTLPPQFSGFLWAQPFNKTVSFLFLFSRSDLNENLSYVLTYVDVHEWGRKLALNSGRETP